MLTDARSSRLLYSLVVDVILTDLLNVPLWVLKQEVSWQVGVLCRYATTIMQRRITESILLNSLLLGLYYFSYFQKRLKPKYSFGKW